MIANQTFETYAEFANNGTKTAPDDAKYAAGFQQSDVLPAEWMNWAWGKNTRCITALNAGLSSAEQEINNVVTAGGATPSASDNTQLLTAVNYLIAQAKAEAILAAHPVGSLYWSSTSTDPHSLFGGTWVQIKDKFVLAAGDTYTGGDTGGAATIQLTEANLPAHSHTINSGNTSSEGTTETAGFRGIKHNHTINDDGHAHSYTDVSHGLTPPSGTSVAEYSLTGYAKGGVTYSTTKNKTGISLTSTAATGYLYGATDSTGSGTAVDKMPPYIVKYCWERTA